MGLDPTIICPLCKERSRWYEWEERAGHCYCFGCPHSVHTYHECPVCGVLLETGTYYEAMGEEDV